ncbi:Abi family protein [Leuconostoc mesenteroides]|uniref:Abi family protein n=1 Tax=Leuconostoc mesenteroides TaxID=1245 RepID=UPI00235E8E96|nr:Abi family protein [Leuconostoc mesenteroides]
MDKILKTTDDMLDFLSTKNIKLGTYDDNKVSQFLTDNTYFFKLISYRKNFQFNNGQYYHLSFDTLVDLSNIDMRLRYMLVHFCLDIEHCIKTKLLNEITFKTEDDGYSFLAKYIASNNNPSKIKQKILTQIKRTNSKLYDKHHAQLPLWVVMECCEFGVLESILAFYLASNPNSALIKLNVNRIEAGDNNISLLSYVRNIRNKAAHNSVILNSITSKSGIILDITRANSLASELVIKAKISRQVRRKRLSISTIHDITTTLAIYDTFIESETMKKRRYKELQDFLKRAQREKELYVQNDEILSVYRYFNQITNYLIETL